MVDMSCLTWVCAPPYKNSKILDLKYAMWDMGLKLKNICLYLLWLTTAGTSLIHKLSLETASTGPPHINPSEN